MKKKWYRTWFWALCLSAAVLAAFQGIFHIAALEVETFEATDETTEKPKVALTFDDGPNEKYTIPLSKELAKRGVKASFFLLGEQIEGNEDMIRQLQKDGHLIGNHGYRHVMLTRLAEKEACEQILTTCKLIYDVTGEYPTYIRPPYGEWNSNLDCGVKLLPAFWTIDSLDWKLKNTDLIVKNVLGEVEDGDIILMHDSFETTVEAALQIVDELLKIGYEFVTVEEMICE